MSFLTSILLYLFFSGETEFGASPKKRVTIINYYNFPERRHDIFKYMLKSVFTRADLQYEYLEAKKTWKVHIGAGSDLVSDCKRSYSTEYKQKFAELFRICLLENDVLFLCIHNKEEIEFSRNNIIENSLNYLTNLGIIISNPFKVDSEMKLLNKLIYKYILSLLDVIFDLSDRSREKEKDNPADDDISRIFEKRIKDLKKQSAKTDITSLIYSIANKDNIELIFDPDYDKAECNYALCIPVYDISFYTTNAMNIVTDVRYIESESNERWYKCDGYYEKTDGVSFTFHDWSKEDSLEKYRQPWKRMIKGFDKYPFKSNSVFKPPQSISDIKSFKILNFDVFNYQLPHYFYYVTKLSEKELEEDKYKHIYDNPALLRYIENKGLDQLIKKYSFTEKKYFDVLIKNILNVLEGLSTIDSLSFFNIGIKAKEYVLTLPDCFINVNPVFRYFKSHKADDKQAIIIFIYSVSVLIDNFCNCISNLTNAEESPSKDKSTYSFICMHTNAFRQNMSNESVSECAKIIKAFLNSQKLEELIDGYRAYYNEYNNSLNELSNIIENTNHRSVLALIDAPFGGENKGFYPFEYLKRSLETLYELLIAPMPE